MDLRNRDIRLDEKSTNDIKMSLIQTGTWPTPQNVEQPYLKFRPRGICLGGGGGGGFFVWPPPPPPKKRASILCHSLWRERTVT